MSNPPSIKSLIETGTLPALGPGPRPGVWDVATLNTRLDVALNPLPRSDRQRDLIRATVLLWHDHLDASHRLAQAIETPDGSYVHGIMHRREPDYRNAKYWFRRVGQHPCFADVAREAAGVLAARSLADWPPTLLPGGQWDPFAFVDACAAAAGQDDAHPVTQALREIQALEFRVLLDRFAGAG